MSASTTSATKRAFSVLLGAALAPSLAAAPALAVSPLTAAHVAAAAPARAAAAQAVAVPAAALALPALSAAAASLPPDRDPGAAKGVSDRVFDAARPADAEPVYAVEFSQPGRVGKLLRRVWPAHTFFRVKQSRTAIDDYLPAKLKAFPQKKPSLLTRIKRSVLFSPPVVALIRSQLARGFHPFAEGPVREIFEKLAVHDEANPGKYNVVIEGGVITVARIDNGAKLPDWVLSKHVLISGYSKDVRFAGELWRSPDGRIYLSNNSGTYRPSAEQLARAVAFLTEAFPGVEFVAAAADMSAAPAPEAAAPAAPRGPSAAFKKELRRKIIHQKNWGYLLAFHLMGYHHTVVAFAGLTAALGVIGVLRLKWKPLREWAEKHVSVLRAKEAHQLTGTFYGALGVTVAVALFGWSWPLVAAGILAYTLGDAISPLVGLRFGWKPYTVAGTKRSLDGTLAAFAVVLGVNLLLGFSPLVALGGALAFSAVDTYPVKPDDNFWIPVVVPAALFLLGLLP